MSYHYLDETRECEPRALPDVEVFWHDKRDKNDCDEGDCWHDEVTGEPLEEGWYYWFYFQGCMLEGKLMGPFASKEEALEDARSQ